MSDFYKWLKTKDESGKDNLGKFVCWTGTWTGLAGTFALSYLMRDNMEHYTELKTAAIGILPYFTGLLGAYIITKTVISEEKQTLTDRVDSTHKKV